MNDRLFFLEILHSEVNFLTVKFVAYTPTFSETPEKCTFTRPTILSN